MVDDKGCRHVQNVLAILVRAYIINTDHIKDRESFMKINTIVESIFLGQGFGISTQHIKEYVENHGKPGHQYTG